MAKGRKTQTIGIGFGVKAALAAVVVVAVILAFLIGRGTLSFDSIKRFMGFSDKPATSAEMSVHFIDVGQGDSILVISNGEAMLIDAGEKDCGMIVADYLDRMNVTKLKYVIGTHPHSDHIGGLSYIIENYDVETVILPKVPKDLTPTTATYERLIGAIKDKGLKIHGAKDEMLSLGESTVQIFAPLGEYTDLNDYSVCTKVTHGENTFLFTGDTEKEAERNLVMRAGKSLDAKVMKLGHHGSGTASTVEILDAVNPRYAVISCGAGNKYGHPHEDAVDRVKKYADYILRTDLSGTIIFESDGEGINVIDITGKNLLE